MENREEKIVEEQITDIQLKEPVTIEETIAQSKAMEAKIGAEKKAKGKSESAHKATFMELFLRYVWITIGAAVYIIGLEFFLVPNDIIDGGVVGISLMTSEITGLPFGWIVVLVNLPFLYLGYKQIGRRFTFATLYGIFCIAIMSLALGHQKAATTDPFLGSIFGGVILGIGVGLIIRNGGSIDGTEIVAIILDKRSGFSVGELVMGMNLFILGAAGFVYSWNSAMYSLIAYFIAYKLMDTTIKGLEESKGVMIVTSEADEIADALLHRLGRGVTILYGEGGYLKEPKRVLYSVVTRLEITKLKDVVHEKDPHAFITVTDVYDVFGGQFSKKSIH